MVALFEPARRPAANRPATEGLSLQNLFRCEHWRSCVAAPMHRAMTETAMMENPGARLSGRHSSRLLVGGLFGEEDLDFILQLGIGALTAKESEPTHWRVAPSSVR